MQPSSPKGLRHLVCRVFVAWSDESGGDADDDHLVADSSICRSMTQVAEGNGSSELS